jgi:hypothetical protein
MDVEVDMEVALSKEIPCRNEHISRIMEIIGQVGLKDARRVYWFRYILIGKNIPYHMLEDMISTVVLCFNYN